MLSKLTILREENIEIAYERKMEKYQELMGEYQEQVWQATCKPIEVSARGFIGRSF